MHNQENLQSKKLIQDIIIGMSDGLTIPFVLTAGLSGAMFSTNLIVVIGLIAIAVGSVTMGVGGFFAGKAVYKEYENDIKSELKKESLSAKAIDNTNESALTVAKKNTRSALNIAFSYILSGLITLSPYFFLSAPLTGFKYSVIISLVCLFIFGFIKSKIMGTNDAWWNAFRVTLIGAMAAAAAFGVAKIFEAA